MLSTVCNFRTTLYDGVLYCGPRCDISVRAHCGDYFEDTSDTRCVDLFAFHLRDCSVHPVSAGITPSMVLQPCIIIYFRCRS